MLSVRTPQFVSMLCLLDVICYLSKFSPQLTCVWVWWETEWAKTGLISHQWDTGLSSNFMSYSSCLAPAPNSGISPFPLLWNGGQCWPVVILIVTTVNPTGFQRVVETKNSSLSSPVFCLSPLTDRSTGTTTACNSHSSLTCQPWGKVENQKSLLPLYVPALCTWTYPFVFLMCFMATSSRKLKRHKYALIWADSSPAPLQNINGDRKVPPTCLSTQWVPT